jgi:hypothetical protein
VTLILSGADVRRLVPIADCGLDLDLAGSSSDPAVRRDAGAPA